MSIKIGPAGLGSVKQAVETLEDYSGQGFEACEIAFTYGVYVKTKQDALCIGKAAKKQKIQLSVHAPYWVNLNSKEKQKVEQSKKRILRACEIGNYLGAYRVVFHPGYYNGLDKEQTYQNIKKAILEMQKICKEKGWKPELAPETTGKVNVFGSVDEILRLVEETRCSFCIDFAHILAREKKINYAEILKKFSKYKKLHLHISGIEYGEKGERRHVQSRDKEARELIENLKKYAKSKEIVIINESPNPPQGAKTLLKFV